jgi:DNA replication and repair protein RecF
MLRVQCAQLSLVNFRNYVRLDLDMASDAVIIVGENAQGKSNLLEAVYCLATTKSFRAGSDRELINWYAGGGDLAYARLSAQVVRQSGPLKLEVVVSEGARREGPGNSPVGKRFKVNGLPKRAFDVIGMVNVVHFAPQDVDLVAGPPSTRRRYLDITIAQVDSRYVRSLAHYGKVLLQRNALLRRIRDRQSRPDQLGYWDSELVNAGAYVVMRRLETVARLARLGHESHRDLAAQRELLEIGYRSTVPATVDPGSDVDARLEAIAEAFREALAAAIQREVALGSSIVGPHRDDLTFQVDGRDVGVYGSRGQQRTVALALKIAEGAFIKEESGEWPILLLDDVMSELDEVRRGQVLGSVQPGQQVILTGTELETIDPAFRERARVLRVQSGAIQGFWPVPAAERASA